MSNFKYLSNDYLLQEIDFRTKYTIIINYSNADKDYKSEKIKNKSLIIFNNKN